MGAEEEVLVTLSGGAPWGFRLQGGSEQKRPLQVSKIRKRSKACRGGLWENDELVSINGELCAGLSHASAMHIIDSSCDTLHICVKRMAGRDRSATRPLHSLSLGQPQVLSPPSPVSPEPAGPPAITPPEPQRRRRQQLGSLTSPPDSEAYYGETDSDADNIAQEKHRRARKKSPRSPPGGSNNKPGEPQDEVSLSELSGYDSTAEAVVQAGEGGENMSDVAEREIVQQLSSCMDTPFSESEVLLQPSPAESRELSPEAMLLPHATRTIRAERHLIPMVGPVEHPVDEDLTTTYAEKAKLAKLHRSESTQEKNVKEAKTKCRTIASLLTDAPNPHSKGVLMFKKRRQRAKKYTLVSFGSVDEDRCYEEEDGVFPTSESEFDEEGFSDARSLTNHSDWDNTYLDIEKPKPESEQQLGQTQQGLSETSGRGARLFEQQRERSCQYMVEKAPAQKPESHQPSPDVVPKQSMMNGKVPTPQKANTAPLSIHVEAVQLSSKLPSSTSAQVQSPLGSIGGGAQPSPGTEGLFNRSARPFTPGFSGQRPVTSSVIFRPLAPKKSGGSLGGQSTAAPPFSPGTPVPPPTAPVMAHNGPASSSTSLYIPAPGSPTPPGVPQPGTGGSAPETKTHTNPPMTSTASIILTTPSKPAGATATPQPRGTSSSSLYISPAPQQSSMVSSSLLPSQPYPVVSPATPRPASEPLTSREQRIAVPAPRTGILQEARRRGSKKPMFNTIEEKKKNSPNPELLSLVQNLDEKPKGDHPGAGFESGPEEDFLSLGAEACNFMQSSGRKFKAPPPVAPKPQQQGASAGLVNGAHDMPQLKGKGAELFAKRQSRMDKFVVEAAPRPGSKPRAPSPTPSLPSSWKYSSNIRAPPPIAYNPLHSPFYPLAASKSQASKAESKVKKAPSQKSGIKAIDFMRHQPYQLKSAMFCFGEPPSTDTQNPPPQPAQQSSLSFTPAKQAPVKTARTYEIRRFSTPAPMPTLSSLAPTVLTPRSATTLDEPVWKTDLTSSAPSTPAPFQAGPSQAPNLYQSSPELSQVGQGTPPRPASSSGFQVARPRFSAAKTGMQAHVWRPGSGHQ
ncbi:synaptopodin 2-like protein isoform X1 [Trachemys scripta elegans]|uniref:synaptopodin 2-like protein isoform X1 n=2 Tax=Trachemys scripta elegans TaxID=31138 RepID=UPI00155248C9|nr:synaptopodin 2-like protein isoform X1 [Trachemys scripta elegans]